MTAHGQATARGLLANMRFQVGRSAEAEDMWQRAAEQASGVGDHRVEADALVWWLISAQHGPTPVRLALERCDAIANQPGTTRKVKAVATVQRGVLSAMQGQIAGGRAMVAQGRQELEELGLGTFGVQQAVYVEQLAGDHLAAEAILRPALDRLAALGERARYSTDAGILAHSLPIRPGPSRRGGVVCAPVSRDGCRRRPGVADPVARRPGQIEGARRG